MSYGNGVTVGSRAIQSYNRYKMKFQKCLFFNFYVFVVWIFVNGMILALKMQSVEYCMMTSYTSVAMYAMMTVLETMRLTMGQLATSRNGVSEMCGFLLTTFFMELPIVSYFLFHPNLKKLTLESILNGSLWVLGILEIVYGYIELRQASDSASSFYISQYRERPQFRERPAV